MRTLLAPTICLSFFVFVFSSFVLSHESVSAAAVEGKDNEFALTLVAVSRLRPTLYLDEEGTPRARVTMQGVDCNVKRIYVHAVERR